MATAYERQRRAMSGLQYRPPFPSQPQWNSVPAPVGGGRLHERWPPQSNGLQGQGHPNRGHSILSSGTYRPNGQGLDVKEMLKREAFDSAAFGCDDHFEKHRPCPAAVHGISDQHVVLDSFEKIESDSDLARGILRFNFAVQNVTGEQRIGVKDVVDTVISVQVCDFCIPLLAEVPYVENPAAGDPSHNSGLPVLTANVAAPAAGSIDVPLTQLPYCGRVTLEFKELSHQSFSDRGGARHHFEFTTALTDAGDRLALQPLLRCETFIFTEPIKDIHGLTLVFRNPDTPLVLPLDCLYGALATVDAAAQLLTFNYPEHGLNVGDRITVTGFTSAAATINRYINRADGHIVGTNGLAADAFRLNPDVDTAAYGLALGDPIPSTSRIDVCIAKNRIRIPLRMRRVVPRLTNYVAPVAV